MRYILDPREAAALAPARATRLHCVTGLLWLVGQRDGADRLLAAGESADLPAGQRHYLSSLGAAGPAAFELSAPVALETAGVSRVSWLGVAPPVPGVRSARSALGGLLERLRHLL
ncbi:DUF2917 domain-containing protein [Pseudoduganella namucuonensis]|uniref:DUF2917 domain-containing protein n=1 Tax=Pseudoduganella namucuonensis TaxID=1035707 RepID=A0A1I7G6J9_9BURK|nr:DUF2917 domain-containing protein [Pseudoduganella namucuonensis]SFU43971.1 Protein of unknown function [Pseudoduganella namucuonensis]